jgi:hypothetical protein
MNNNAKNFALQLGSLIGLYVSLTAVIWLAFGVINTLYPDESLGYYQYESTQQGIRIGIAMLIVFFPVYILLTRLVNNVRRKETGMYLSLTKWLTYLSLIVAGLFLLGDLVTVIFAYLNGEVTMRLILKALTIFVVIGGAFYYYIQDAKEYWNIHEKESKMYAGVVSIFAIGLLFLGFIQSDTPEKVRQMRLDDQQTMDLNDLQYRVEDHYRINKTLPQDSKGLYIGTEAPKASEGRKDYSYKIVDEDTFELCATFAYPSQNARSVVEPFVSEPTMMKNPYNNWDHGVGETCFERTVIKETILPMQ